MTALGDTEDPPPNERPGHERDTEPDTEPDELHPPRVQVVADESTDSDQGGFRTNERASLQRTQHELAALRMAILEGNQIGKASISKLDGILERLSAGANFMSRLSLKIDMPEAKPNGLTGKRVLVVEDDCYLLDLVETMLCRLGCNVTGASTRLEAETLLAATPRPFHAALIDVRIPSVADDDPHEREGVELVRWMRIYHPAVAVIVTSDGDMTSLALDALPVARLEKPLTLEELNASLYSVLGHGCRATADTERPPPPPPSLRDFDADEPDTEAETPEAKAKPDASPGDTSPTT